MEKYINKKFKIFFLIFLIFTVPLFGVNNQKLFECYKIFEEKKTQLRSEAEQILEQQEALESLKSTYLALIKKKEAKLKAKETDINATLSKIENEKKEIENLIQKNNRILQAIKDAKLNKLTQSYAKMRPKNAAQILDDMDEKDALNILQQMPARVLAKIFSKMDPVKAAKFSESLQNENNKSMNIHNSSGG